MGKRFVWRDGAFRDRATGEPMPVADAPLAAPRIMRPMPEYASPIDGRMITTRGERIDDMARNNCVEAGDAGMSPTNGRIRNKAFAAKRGLTVSEEFR